MKTEVMNDKVIITFDKPVQIQTESTWIYNIKKIVIETIDVVLECFDKDNQLMSSVFYRINGNETIYIEDYEDNEDLYLIEDGVISEDIFRWNMNH